MYWPCGVPRVYAHNAPQRVEDDSEELAVKDEKVTDAISETIGKFHGDVSEKESVAHEPSWDELSSREIIGLRVARSDHLFADITKSRLTLWQNRPMVVLAEIVRSRSSLRAYGYNIEVLLRPDSTIAVVRTAHGFLLTYSIDSDPSGRAYNPRFEHSQGRRQSLTRGLSIDESTGFREFTLRFRRAIKIDAGINGVLALDKELIVATAKPSAVQCIRWSPDEKGSQTSAELLSKMDWLTKKTSIIMLVHDRAMNLSVWIAQDGRAFAVQRASLVQSNPQSSEPPNPPNSKPPSTKKLFHGYCFHDPRTNEDFGLLTAINAKFSLLAVNCANGEIWIYTAKDYVGNILFSHKMPLPVSSIASGKVTCLSWSPDGYCLFAGFEQGWAMWSVFGKPGASSFNVNESLAESNKEHWLQGISSASWISGGSEVLLTSSGDHRIWKLEMSRSAAVGCFSFANLMRALLQTPSELIIYGGHDLPDLTSISNEASLWHHIQYPATYLHTQWPIRSCVISQDGCYVAIAGRRGLAHYSVHSGRWKSFIDAGIENSFAVRGGMCWFGHVLIAATESEGSYGLQLFSREMDLGRSTTQIEELPAPIVFIGPSGEDSLLVYTYDNTLYHYVINLTSRGFVLVPVGQIAFHGVIRSPTRVRSVSWILPETQLRNGDPSRDVEFASVLFLVDDKLVLLKPSQTAEGALKYEMRVVAQHIEFYMSMRDQVYFNFASIGDESAPQTPSAGADLSGPRAQQSLRDSLWTFDGEDLRVWGGERDILRNAAEGQLNSQTSFLLIPVDFYPLSILLNKGIVLGVECELLQRRDVNFAQLRTAIRTHLFIPYVLRHLLCEKKDTSAAFALTNQYEELSYFAHALEILLHNVLDDEVDGKYHDHADGDGNSAPSNSSLPTVLSFLQSCLSPASYLSTIVNCIRKTELSFWRTLFAYLPTPVTLFKQALELDDLKTASGYLLVLQGLDESARDEDEPNVGRLEKFVVTLMRLSREKGDFELCAELARFVTALDPHGKALARVIEEAGFREKKEVVLPTEGKSVSGFGSLTVPKVRAGKHKIKTVAEEPRPQSTRPGSGPDYFVESPGEF